MNQKNANTDKQQLSSTHPTVSQSMDVAATLLTDILQYLYHIKEPEVIWGILENRQPAFQYSFQKNDNNLIGANLFVTHFLEIKSEATHSIDPENGLIAFQGLMGMSIFMKHLMEQNNFIPDPALLQNTPKPRKNRFISHVDLLALKEDFYISVSDCIKDADKMLQEPFNDTSLFVYSLKDLERSVNLAQLALGGHSDNYTTDSVFHIH